MADRDRSRPPPALTRAWLRQQADAHLKRFVPSVAQLRRVLRRRADRALAWHGGGREDALALVEEVLAELIEAGRLDDRRVAAAWAGDLHRRGLPRRAIQGRIAAKGIESTLAHQALEALDTPLADPELERACAYVRRRRLGPARPEHRIPALSEDRRKQREKDLAALCRAGFSFGIALRVVDAEDLDELLDAASLGEPAPRPGP